MKRRGIALVLLALLLAGCGGPAADSGTKTAEASGGEPAGAETTTQSSERTGKDRQPASGAPELPTVTIDPSGGEKFKVRVEIADSALGRYIGLRGRKSLPEDRGMLFVHPDEEQLSFTMDDTLIPLSIAFMDSEGRIVDIQDMKPLTEGPYISAKLAQYALEVNQGFFEEHGVKVGDKADLPV